MIADLVIVQIRQAENQSNSTDQFRNHPVLIRSFNRHLLWPSGLLCCPWHPGRPWPWWMRCSTGRRRDSGWRLHLPGAWRNWGQRWCWPHKVLPLFQSRRKVRGKENSKRWLNILGDVSRVSQAVPCREGVPSPFFLHRTARSRAGAATLWDLCTHNGYHAWYNAQLSTSGKS